jgi:DNA-binding LacI/PurR family transcriptional regulator
MVWHNDPMSVEMGRSCAARLLELPAGERPDAVFSTNDALALGFMDGLRSSGLAIPDNLSLIGFDNLPASSWTPYQLTTFEQPLDAMVGGVLDHIAAHELRRLGSGDAVATSRAPDNDVIYCPPRLIHRNTTRCVQ